MLTSGAGQKSRLAALINAPLPGTFPLPLPASSLPSLQPPTPTVRFPKVRLPSFWTAFASIPLLMAGGLGAGAAWLVVRPDLVLVEHIDFVGAEHADQRALRHLADMPNGTTIWGVDPTAIAHGVEHHPWVRHATVERVWPDGLRVTLEERTPVALLAIAERTYVLDEQGVPFLVADGRALDLPLILGLAPELAERHPELPQLVLRDALWLIREIPVRTGVSADAISSVAFHTDTGMSVTVGHSRVVFGLEDLPRQMDRLERLVNEAHVALDEPLLIDLAPATVAIVRSLAPANAG